jgi:hypothetical protein
MLSLQFSTHIALAREQDIEASQKKQVVLQQSNFQRRPARLMMNNSWSRVDQPTGWARHVLQQCAGPPSRVTSRGGRGFSL